MAGSRREAGFSLIEMMVVVSILGILAAISIPTFRGMMPRIRLNNNMMLLSNQIAVARVRAISKSSDFRIEFNPAADNYLTSRFSGAWQSLGTETMAGTDLVSAAILDPPNPSIALNPANTLSFGGNGQVTNVPIGKQAAVELRTPNGAIRKRIKVEATGRMSVERWAGSAWVEE